MDMRNKHVLLTNLYLEKYQGSEINCLSLAKALRAMGAEVELATLQYGLPIQAEFQANNLKVKNILTENPDRSHYDLIWAHHSVVLDNILFEKGITADRIVFSSLSPFEPLEAPPAYTNLLSLCIANSNETRQQNLSENIREDLCVVFPNYISREDYLLGRSTPTTPLRKIAIVSNHLADEIKEAEKILRNKDITVDIFGLGYRTVLITPEVLLQYDAIVTIGKTVQYGMGLNIPVYCYDIHGGPGWIRESILDKAFQLNFSGRGFSRKSGAEIADEILSGFDNAVSETAFLRQFCHDHCILEENLSRMLKKIAARPAVPIAQIKKEYAAKHRENKAFLRLYRAHEDLQPKLQKFEQVSQELLNAQGHVELLLQSERDLMHAKFVLEGNCRELDDRLKTQEQTNLHLSQNLTIRTAEYTQTKSALEASQNRAMQLQDEKQQLQFTLACREGECQQLRDKENMLKNDIIAIRNSRSYRIGQKFAAVARFFVPSGSKRALFARLLWTFLRHPMKFLQNLTPRKIKKFLRNLRKGNVAAINGMIYSNITGQPLPSALEVITPEIAEISQVEKTIDDYPVLTVPQWEEPQVSIVIPVYNQFEFTYHCVESILKNSGDITYEIIIANDCSTDLTTEIDKILPGVNCVTNEKNLRFLRNCNNAAKYAKGKYVLFLNNDTQVQENWLEPLVTLIESAEDIGMVGSKLIYPDGLLQEAGGILWRDGSAWNFGNRQNPALPQFNYVKQVDYISGAAIMLSRRLWEEIGGFDEHFAPAYCEDSDLAFTVRKMGYRVMYQPLSVVVHFEGVSNGTDTSSGQKRYQVENSIKFKEKWAEELAKHPENAENVFQARDYSFGKKTLLMVDHYVPHFDKDAGSRTVFQYLKLFVKAGFNVKFIGDNFYQHEPYTTVLQQMGIEVLYGPDAAGGWQNWIRENAEHFDYVFLNRPHIAPKYLDFIRQHTNARIIYYGHDLAFVREMREYEITGDASFRDSSIEWQGKELALMRQADVAYYPSYVEVDAIHAIDPAINVKAIPAYLFEDVAWEGYDFDSRKDIMFIGGFSHRPNVDAVKWLANEIMPELVKLLPDIKVHILGSNAPKEVLALASKHLIIEGFVTDEQLEQFYRGSRLSLVPLRYGAGIKGKVIEAMRFGTPVVTTPTGSEGIPNAEAAMIIESDAKEIARKIAAVYHDRDRLVDMSKNCISYIQENYSPANAIQVIGPDFDIR